MSTEKLSDVLEIKDGEVVLKESPWARYLKYYRECREQGLEPKMYQDWARANNEPLTLV